MSFQGKHILLGVTGGIAAYKIPLLVRLLVKEGASVRVMMTPAARDFVTPLTLSVLSRHPVAMDFTAPDGTWQNHVEWARWADAILVAPLTANSLAKLAAGRADNFLTATIMSAECPVAVAPAMDAGMYQYGAVKENLKKLQDLGFLVIPADEGELASGLVGQGRMPEPPRLLDRIAALLEASPRWQGKKVVITSGPTYEHIDPVRFIGNHSSGKTGKFLADTFHRAGADVLLITGPTCVLDGDEDYEVKRVTSAAEMFRAVKAVPDARVYIMAAAVADYCPVAPAESKIKKSGERLLIELEPNPDILAYVGSHKKKGQIVVGFALETDNETANALEKLKKKNADIIVLNSLRDEGAGFGGDTNKITVFHANGERVTYPLKSKKALAKDLLHEVEKYV